MRFLEAMRSRDARSFALPRRPAIELQVRAGDDELAGARIEREAIAPGVRIRRLTVARDRRAGTYFAPPGGRHPAVLLLGGSEGGSNSARPEAAQLATLGSPALVPGAYVLPSPHGKAAWT
jgi:hypothetical protein